MRGLPFSGLPAHLWLSVAVAVSIGIAALVAAILIKKAPFWKELIRDLGVAFIVAGVVSAIYEYSTRSIAERESVLDTINRAMSAVVPDGVWREVTEQILHRNAIRRNVKIDIRLSRDVTLTGGKTIHLPSHQAVLWMSLGYDLYSLAADGSRVSVEHELDYEMKKDDLQLPRFERVIVSGPNAGDRKMYEGPSLQAICANGIVTLDGTNIVSLPAASSAKPVRITTERSELVNVPGAYNLVMQELAARSDHGTEPTIKVVISEIPDDIEPDVYTYYPPHSFTKLQNAKNTWVLHSVLLPGQGLTIVFRVHDPGETRAPASSTKSKPARG